MRKRIFICLSILFFLSSRYQQIFAQSTIHGIIKNIEGKPLQFANILLLKPFDSSLVKGVISDENGKYEFYDIKVGKYIIAATFTGMNEVYSPLLEILPGEKSIDAGELILNNTPVKLIEITVPVTKPIFEQKIDRIVINVKNSIIDLGGTALDILQKTPGVTVNRQDNSISVNGKSGVVVMINGKISYMPMDALVQFLSGINAANIEKIELITTPPAKYDAAGNAGFINIVLVNNPNQGVNGSYFLSGGYGKRELYSAGGNINYRTERVNLFGSYNFNHEHIIQTGKGFSQEINGADIITNNSFSKRDVIRQVHNIRLGIDYQLDSTNVIGALVSGYNTHSALTANNGATEASNNVLDTTISTINTATNRWQNLLANINFQHTFRPGKALYLDANYIYYRNDNPNEYANQYYKGSDQYLFTQDIQSAKATPIIFQVYAIDYTTPFGKNINMETGAKLSLSRLKNNVNVQTMQGGNWISDPNLSADYLLNENIASAYASFNINLNSKTTLKTGLRYEFTKTNLSTTSTPNLINRNYGNLFPTFFLSRQINDDNSINFSYSLRITRPTYNDLAPFTIFYDPKRLFTGNPTLKPATANNLQVSYIFKSYIFSLSYTYENNTIEPFQTEKIDPITNIVYTSVENFTYEQFVTANLLLPFSITKWWSIENNVNVNWKQLNTIYSNGPFRLQAFDMDINSTQHFILARNLSMELTGFYSTASYIGTQRLQPIYQVDAGLQKKFSNTKDALRFSANDIFNTGTDYRLTENLPIPNTFIKGSLNYGRVAFKLNWTHNFGKKELKVKRNRSTGAEEELRRVHDN